MKINTYKNKCVSYKSLLSLLLLVVLISSLLPTVYASLGTFQQNNCVQIKTILNTTAVNISTINYPNSTIAISNKAMTKTGYTFNYSFCNTSNLGVYIYDYFDADGNVYVNDFEITSTGQKVSLSNIILVIVFLVSTILFFILGYSFDKEKWMIKSFFNLCSLLSLLLAINSAKIIASESLNLGKMGDVGFILLIPIISVFFLYVFILWTIQTFKSFKKKEATRWEY